MKHAPGDARLFGGTVAPSPAPTTRRPTVAGARGCPRSHFLEGRIIGWATGGGRRTPSSV